MTNNCNNCSDYRKTMIKWLLTGATSNQELFAETMFKGKFTLPLSYWIKQSVYNRIYK